MKIDRRVRYTKNVIKESFFDLLVEKQAHKITVKELCEKADINRATFYSHYSDIYALTEELQENSIYEFKKLLSKFSNEGNDNVILCFLNMLQDNNTYFAKLIFGDDTSKYFIRLFVECKEEILSLWLNDKNKLTPKQQEWLYTFLASGCASIMRTWVMGGMKESTEEVADFINQLTTFYSAFP